MNKRNISFTIRIPIPNWFPDKADIRRWYRTQKYKLFPFRCTKCNTAIDFKRPIYRVYDGVTAHPYQRILVQSPMEMCTVCFNDFVKVHFKLYGACMPVKKCHCCGKEARVASHLTQWGTLGYDAWNNAELCVDCITFVIDNGCQESSYLWHDPRSDSMFFINEAGAVVSKI